MPFSIGPKHHNVIPRELQEVIDFFFSLTSWETFCLTGGTCLAEYYFGHRLSEDTDFFTTSREELAEAKKMLTDPRRAPVDRLTLIRSTDYLIQFFYRKEPKESEVPPIKMDIVLDTAHRILPPVSFENVRLDSLEDILSNKIGRLISRNAIKDFLDLYQLIPASHLTAKELIELGLVKEGGLDPLIIAHQMEFIFKMSPPSKELLGKTDWKDFLLFFKKFQKECLDLVRPS